MQLPQQPLETNFSKSIFFSCTLSYSLMEEFQHKETFKKVKNLLILPNTKTFRSKNRELYSKNSLAEFYRLLKKLMSLASKNEA